MISDAVKPYLYGAAAIGWAVSLVAVGWWQRNDGSLACQNSWLKQHDQELSDATTEVDKLRKAAVKQQTDWAAVFAANDAQLRKENSDAKAQRDSILADVKSGKLVLHDPGVSGGNSTANTASSGGRENEPPSSGPGSTENVPGRFSGETSEFLIGEANRADERTRTLNKCIKDLAVERGLPRPDTQ